MKASMTRRMKWRHSLALAVLLSAVVSLSAPAGGQTTTPRPARPPGQSPAALTPRPTPSQPTPPHGQDKSITLHILFHTDLGGRYHWPGCRQAAKGKADYAQLVSTLDHLRKTIRDRGDPGPIVLSTGTHIGPDVFAQFLTGLKSNGLSLIVSMMKAMGYDAVLLSRQDLAEKAAGAYAKALARIKIPLLTANLLCNDPNNPRCKSAADRKKRFVIVTRAGVKIAVVGLLPQDLDAMLGSVRSAGLSVTEPRTWLTETLKRIRKQHLADIVVLLSDMDTTYSAPRRILDLLRRLGKLAPDVTISNSLYDAPSGSGTLVAMKRSDGRLVLASGRFGQDLGHLVLKVRPKGSRTEIIETSTRHIHTASFPPRPDLEQKLKKAMARLCKKLDVPLGKGRLAHPMSRSEFIRYSLEVTRRAAHAELAALPDSLFSEAGFPMTGTMTKEKIRRAIRTNDHVVMMIVKGSWLKKKLNAYLSGDRPKLWITGLTKKGLIYYVNGRVLEPDWHYGVATTDFVAQGGEGLVPRPKLFIKVHPHRSLRQTMEYFFAHRLPNKGKSGRIIDLEKNFVPLRDRFLLATTMSMNLALTDVSILHPGIYSDQPQLNRERLTGLTVNASVTGLAVNSVHSIKGTASLKYGKTRTWVTNELTGIDEKATLETDDLVTFTFLYKFLRLHSRYDPKRWFYPVPFLETYVETELTKNLVAQSGKLYRYTETAGILGTGFRLYPKLFAKIGFVSRSHNILVPEERMAERGLYVGVDLDRTALVAQKRYKLYLQSDLDFVFVRMADKRIKELIWTNKLAFAFIDHLFFTINHEFYLYDTRDGRLNLASNLTAGIQVLLDLRHQLD